MQDFRINILFIIPIVGREEGSEPDFADFSIGV